MDFNNLKKIHFVGIGGIGTSAIAKMFLKQGKTITGSDLSNSEIIEELKKRGMKIKLGHNQKNLSDDCELLIYSPAVPLNNPERQKAKKLKIRQLSYPQILGEISKTKWTIAISGTNGKSTTTALIGLIMKAAGFDPTVIVGSKVQTFDENFEGGKGQYFVVEGCEWKANMLNLSPRLIVLTNIEEEHLDYYKNLDNIIKTFRQFVAKLPVNGILVINNDDKNSKKIKPKIYPSQLITYGIQNRAQVMAKDIKVKEGKQIFTLYNQNKNSGQIILKVPGLFNIYNALAAITVALSLGVKMEIIKKTLADFKGIWRRFEIIGKTKGALIISDYAHHPTAIRETIKAAKDFYPQRRIMAVFQPHHHHRTKVLFDDFVSSLDKADLIILAEIYAVAGREKNKEHKISSKDLVESIKKRDLIFRKQRTVFYAPNLQKTKELIEKYVCPNDLVLLMGAGDIYTIYQKSKTKNQNYKSKVKIFY